MSKLFLKAFIGIAFLLCAVYADTTVDKTNLAISFTQNLFNDGLNFLAPVVLNNLNTYIDLTNSIPWYLKAAIQKMIILNIPAPQNDFIDTVLESPRDAKITITDLKMNVDAEPLVGRKLTLIIVNKCVLDLSINSNSNTGRPELSMSVETLDISVFDEKGKNVGLIENLASWLKDIIFSSVQEALNNLFKEVTMTPTLGETPIAIDLSMYNPPYTSTINNINVLTINFAGSFLNNNALEESKKTYDNITPLNSDTMISLNFGAAVSNSLVSVLRDLGYLRYSVSADSLPESTKGYLNTKFFRFLFSELYKQYPDTDLRLTVNASKDPNFTLSKEKKGINFDTEITLRFDIKQEDGSFDEKSDKHSVSLVFNPKALVSADLQKDEKAGLYILYPKVDYEKTTVNIITEDTKLENALGDFRKILDTTLNGIFQFGASTLNLLVREGIKIDPKRWKLGFGIPKAVLEWTDKNCGIGIDVSFPEKGTDDYDIIDNFFNKMLAGVDLNASINSSSRRSVNLLGDLGNRLTQKLMEPFTESVKKAVEKTTLFAVRQLDRLAERAKKEDLLGDCKKGK